MASLPSPESRDVQEMVCHLKWSHTEKQIARKAFELALDREFRSVIRRAKDLAGQSRQKTAFQRGRTPASRWFLVPVNIYTNPCR
jgi:hypothetical protein